MGILLKRVSTYCLLFFIAVRFYIKGIADNNSKGLQYNFMPAIFIPYTVCKLTNPGIGK